MLFVPTCTSIGPLLFALPLEKAGSEWQYALVLEQKLALKRTAMPSHWDWPLAPPLTVTAAARRIVWEDVWSLPANASAVVRHQDQDSIVDIELVPYGCSKMYLLRLKSVLMCFFPYGICICSHAVD